MTDLILTPVAPSVALGETVQFTAQGDYSDGRLRDLTARCTWSSSAPNIAWIDAAGLAHTIGEGVTQIAVDYPGFSSQTTLTVEPPALVGIELSPSTPSVVRGLALAFTATGTFTDGSTLDLSASAVWSSSNLAVATIDAAGVAQAL